MKGPNLALLIWVANVALIAGGGFLGWRVYSSFTSEHKDARGSVAVYQRKEKPIKDWDQSSNEGKNKLGIDPKGITPYERPPKIKKIEQKTPALPPPVIPPPTIEQQREHTENWVLKTEVFKIVRLIHCAQKPALSSGTMTSKSTGKTKFTVWPELSFRSDWGQNKKVKDKTLKALGAMDIVIKAIEPDSILMSVVNQHPKGDKKLRFDVLVPLSDSKASKFDPDRYRSVGRAWGDSDPVIESLDKDVPPPVVEIVDTRPKESIKRADGVWDLGTDDYKNINVDELVKYTKIVTDRDGKAVGIQLSEDIPDDSVLVKRGGRSGDIIKSINNKTVLSMSDARRIVRTEYNTGIDQFSVIFERDGIRRTETFNVPRKKNTEENN